MSRTIMDVTQLAHRTGKITGIPRVMDELAKRFRKSENEQVIFVSWVTSQQEFYEIDFEQTLVRREGVIYKQRGSEATGQAVTKGSLPLSNQQSGLLRQAAKKGFAAAKRISPRLAENIESRAVKAHMSQYDAITFSKSDVFLIPWGEWWNTDFTERLLAAHDEGAKIVQVIHDIGPTVWPQFFEQLEINPTTYNAKPRESWWNGSDKISSPFQELKCSGWAMIYRFLNQSSLRTQCLKNRGYGVTISCCVSGPLKQRRITSFSTMYTN